MRKWEKCLLKIEIKETKIKLMNKKLIIFDMDGTLIDSTGLWHEIDKKFFAKRNMDLPKDYAQKIVHLGLKQAAIFTKKEYGIKERIWHQRNTRRNHSRMAADGYRFLR